jgi:hypothetical protein
MQPLTTALVWPLKGVTQPGSTRTRVLLQSASGVYQTGMRLRVYGLGGAGDNDDDDNDNDDEDDDGNCYLVTGFAPGDVAMVLEDPGLPAGVNPVGLTYRLLERAPDPDVTKWDCIDTLTAIQNMYDNTCVPANVSKADLQSFTYQLHMLSTPEVTLTPDSTADDIQKAWGQQRFWLDTVRTQALLTGVIGQGPDDQYQRYMMLQSVIMTYLKVYEAASATKLLEAGVTSGGAVDLTASYTNPWWYRPDTLVKEKANVELIDFLICEAKRQGLRKSGSYVYEQVYTDHVRWKPDPRNPRCTAVNCVAFACYGSGNVRERCEAHARQHDTDLRARVPVFARAASARCAVPGCSSVPTCGPQVVYSEPACTAHSTTPARKLLPGHARRTDLAACCLSHCNGVAITAMQRPATQRDAVHCQAHRGVVPTGAWCRACVPSNVPVGGQRLHALACDKCGSDDVVAVTTEPEADLQPHPADTVYMQLAPSESIVCRTGTQSYRPVMHYDKPLTIRQWILKTITRDLHYTLWCKLVEHFSPTIKTLVEFMTDVDDYAFPMVHPTPTLFSFRNGLYNIARNEFMEYGSPAAARVSSVCASNFIDEEFNVTWTRVDPLSIRVPGYDDILDSQLYDTGMRHWLDVFLGRLFFPLHTMGEKWEKLFVIKGYAATGKSTLAAVVASIIGEPNVGFISSNCEEQWALANLQGKRVWMCLEMKNNFALPANEMQSMTTGEPVNIHEKRQTAVTVTWTSPGVLVGNELPESWSKDVGGALVRRVVPFPFDIPPRTQSPAIAAQFRANRGAFLVRIVRSYLHEARLQTHAAFETRLPKKLQSAMLAFQHHCQPLLAFFRDSPYLEVATTPILDILRYELFETQGKCPDKFCLGIENPGALASRVNTALAMYGKAAPDLLADWCAPMDKIAEKFRAWCQQNSIKPVNIALEETWLPACKTLGVFVMADVAVGRAGKVHRRAQWYGIKLRQGGMDDE